MVSNFLDSKCQMIEATCASISYLTYFLKKAGDKFHIKHIYIDERYYITSIFLDEKNNLVAEITDGETKGTFDLKYHNNDSGHIIGIIFEIVSFMANVEKIFN